MGVVETVDVINLLLLREYAIGWRNVACTVLRRNIIVTEELLYCDGFYW